MIKKLNKYKYLMFDADDTLLDFKMAEKEALKRVLKNNNLPYDDKTVALYSAINDKCWKMYERGEIKRDDIFPLRFGEFLNILKSDKKAEEINYEYFSELRKCYFLMNGAKELLDYCKNKYELFIITNGVARTQYERLKGSKIFDLFKGVFISEELGAQKPSTMFFEKALKAMGNPNKNECLILGDSLSGDILGGKNIGIDTCFVNLRNIKNETDITPNYEIHSLLELKEML